MPSLTPCLWFNGDADEAIAYYSSVLPDTKVTQATRMPDGKSVHGEFELLGARYMFINHGGQSWEFNESMSLAVSCDGQEETDRYYDALIADGGTESMCGWLKDRFGLWWQVFPKQLGDYIGGPDQEGAGRATQAMMQMKRIDLTTLEKAYAGS